MSSGTHYHKSMHVLITIKGIFFAISCPIIIPKLPTIFVGISTNKKWHNQY